MRVCPREARVGSQRQQWGRCGLCTCSPCQRSGCLAHPRRPRRPAFCTSAPGCGLTRLFPEGHGARTHREPTRPETANPLREPTFREPTFREPTRTHCEPTCFANPPREPTRTQCETLWCFPCEPTLQVGSRKVGSNRSGFGKKWVRVETIPNPMGQWVRSGFDQPSLLPSP